MKECCVVLPIDRKLQHLITTSASTQGCTGWYVKKVCFMPQGTGGQANVTAVTEK